MKPRAASLQLLWLGLLSAVFGLAVSQDNSEYFVEVRDGRFQVGCTPFYVSGWNQWEAVEAAAGAPKLSGASIPEGMTGPELVRKMIERGSEIGFNAMRIFAFTVNPQYALQTKPGVYSEAAFKGLDYILDEASKNNIRLILAMTSNWTPVGGLPQYLEWAGKTDPVDFYTDPEIKQMYKDFVKTLLTRVNTINGRTYLDDPTIMAIDLFNEPRCENCSDAIIADWYAEMADYVRSIDPNHMITTGEEGLYGCCKNPGNPGVQWSEWAAEVGQDFVKDHESENITFATMHFWPDNWQAVSEQFQQDFLQTRMQDAEQVLKKPVLLEEWGKWVNVSAGATHEERDAVMARMYRDIKQYMSQPNSPLMGSMFWQWYWEGQMAAVTERSAGGNGGLFGIYESDPAFDLIKENVQFIQSLNTPIEGCDISTAKKATIPKVENCSSTWVDGEPGTGFEGPTCNIPINECVRGTDTCDPNAACLDTETGYTCKCYYGYSGDGHTCTLDESKLTSLEKVYFTTPKAVSCRDAVPVNWPEYAPGFVYDPMDSYKVCCLCLFLFMLQ